MTTSHPVTPTTVRNMTVQPGSEPEEMVFVRHLPGTPDAAFAAWTDPAKLAAWWGPHDFTNPECDVDLRVGGAYRIVMQSPSGERFPVNGAYLELDRPHRLVLTDSAEEMPEDWQRAFNRYRQGELDAPPLQLVMTVTFEADGDGTKMVVTDRYADLADLKATLEMGAVEGWAQSLEKLETLLSGD